MNKPRKIHMRRPGFSPPNEIIDNKATIWESRTNCGHDRALVTNYAGYLTCLKCQRRWESLFGNCPWHQFKSAYEGYFIHSAVERSI